VSERAGVKAGGSNPSAMTPSRVVTVEGILVSWKAALFAGRRRNEGLGRSVGWRGHPPTTGGAPVTADVRRTPRRGTSSRMRHKAHAPDAGTRDRRMRSADASFARSFDPCASILTTHEASKASSWWGERTGITVGQTHASGRNHHWGRTFGRCAARRTSPLPQGRGRDVSKKRKEVAASVPARIKSPGWFARTSWFSCRSLQATSGLE
jgi:hypothetical protein